MITDTFYAGSNIVEVDGLVVWMTGVASHKEFLPNHEAVFIAKLIEVVAFHDTATPKSDEVHATLVCVFHFSFHAGIGGAEHGFRNPVGSTDEDALAVDGDRHLAALLAVHESVADAGGLAALGAEIHRALHGAEDGFLRFVAGEDLPLETAGDRADVIFCLLFGFSNIQFAFYSQYSYLD